jgi:hypothetical protein
MLRYLFKKVNFEKGEVGFEKNMPRCLYTRIVFSRVCGNSRSVGSDEMLPMFEFGSVVSIEQFGDCYALNR